jgi:hypothetical protein
VPELTIGKNINLRLMTKRMGFPITIVQNNENDDLHELEGLGNYIDVLVASFPKSISRKELAREAGVSEAAIAKVRNRLFRLCDQNAIVFGHRLILKTDETFWKLLVLYFLQMRPTKMLLSNYGWQMIKRMNLHSKISERFKDYSFHFNEKDTEIMTRIVLYNVGNFQILNQIRTNIGDPQQRVLFLSMQYLEAVQSILQRLDLPIEGNEDLLDVLTIRDKLFYFVKELLCQQVQKTSILRELSTKEKATFLRVYSKTIDFYLRKVFGIGTSFIKQVAGKRKLEFKEEYEKIGLFYTPLPK